MIDRDALIEAAAKARYERSTGHIWAELPEQTRDCYRTECGNWLVAALPLIAEAIEARAEMSRRQTGGYSEYSAYREAARLVRSLLGTDSDR